MYGGMDDRRGGGGKGGGFGVSTEVRPGDWECPKCGMNVFASKFQCFKCGTDKPRDSGRNRRRDSRSRSDSRRRR